jgi:phosphoribosyl 1,2-cyclic phosphodiesterase
VRRLCLFHHDPDHTDAKIAAMEAAAQAQARELGSPIEVMAAREGLVLPIP